MAHPPEPPLAQDCPQRVQRAALDDRLYLQSVGRALELLEVFENAHRAKSLNEIAADLGVTKSAAQRTIYTLLAHGYLEKASGTGYRLGQRVLDATFNFLRLDPLVQRAAPVLTELRRNANERVDLSLFDDTTSVYALRYQSKRETFYAALVGRRRPTFLSAGGRACLAQLDDFEIQSILERSELVAETPRTTTNIDEIWDKILQARQDRYACSIEEAFMGEIVVAAAILDHRRRPSGAVHIAGLLGDWTEAEFRARFAPLALEAARALSG